MMNQNLQYSNNNGSNGNGTPKRVVVLHRQGSAWRFLRLSRAEKGGRVEIEDQVSIAVSDQSGLQRLLTAAEADVVVQILPGGTVVCRTVQFPKLTDETLGEVLELQSEAALPAGIAEHRRAVTLLPWSQELADEFEALAFGWPGSVPVELEREGIRFRYAAVVAGLTEILCRVRGDAFAAYLDRDTGTFELLLHHDGRTVVRTIRLAANEQAWSDQLASALTETALAIGLAVDELSVWGDRLREQAERFPQLLLLSDEARDQLLKAVVIDQKGLELAWWNKFGLAVVTGLGIFGPRQRLFELLAERPAERRNPLAVLCRWIDEPGRAGLVLLLAVLVISLVPLGSSWARQRVLAGKLGDATAVERRGLELANQAQYYKFLDAKRWPMTKLIADISGSAPYEVQIDELVIDSESKVVRLKGKAPSHQELTIFQMELGRTGIFKQISVPRAETKFQKVEFEMTFKVGDALRRVERSFTDSLAVVLYGEADGKVEDAGAGVGAGAALDLGASESGLQFGDEAAVVAEGSAAVISRPAPPRENSVMRAELESGVLGSGGSGNGVPAALTVEAIEAMGYQEVLDATKAISRHLYDRTLDPATKTRLRDEYVRLTNRLKKLKADDGAGD